MVPVNMPRNTDKNFECIWRKFQQATPITYRKISFEVFRLLHGPELPDKAFANLDTLRSWYHAVLHCWLVDSLAAADIWHGRLPAEKHELALSHVVLEARNTGIRRIHRRIFREGDGVPRNLPIGSYSELSTWCDFMFELIGDDEQFVEFERQVLTFRYDEGVSYRLEEERKNSANKHGEWVADVTSSMMKAVSKAEPHTVEPDDDWLLVIWGGLADRKKGVRETTVSLFVDAKPKPKKLHTLVLEDIISETWKVMRQLGPAFRDEPRVTNPKQVRKYLDAVKRFCASQECQSLAVSGAQGPKRVTAHGAVDKFVLLANGEATTRSFQKWAGGDRVTLAVVFTDVVASTALGEQIRDEAMNEVRRAHFARSRELITQFKGREIKTIGDSFMTAFRCVDAALDYARALHGTTGHPKVRIRAGIHIGPMHVEEGDVFGGTVNFAARVVGAIQGAEIWLSEQAKGDIDRLGAAKHKKLKWERREGISMKGFSGKFTLWSLSVT